MEKLKRPKSFRYEYFNIANWIGYSIERKLTEINTSHSKNSLENYQEVDGTTTD